MAVEASVIIDFEGTSADEVSGTILVELDDEYAGNLDLEGNVKGTFLPEEAPVFIIHHDPTIEITDVRCTDGTVRQLSLSGNYRTRELDGLFTRADTEISLSYYGADDLRETWYGNEGTIRIDGMNVVADDGTFPCYCTAIFSVPFNQRWQLTPPPLDLADDETYTIYVVVYAREIT